MCKKDRNFCISTTYETLKISCSDSTIPEMSLPLMEPKVHEWLQGSITRNGWNINTLLNEP